MDINESISHGAALNEMRKFSLEGPFVGLFWIDDDDELLDVSKLPVDNLNGSLTIPVLHKTLWQKKHFRAIQKKETGALSDKDKIYLNDYTKVRRGRIFYKDGVFTIKVGSWITPAIIDNIKDEFELPEDKTVVSTDSHWDIGHGWSSEQDQLEL